MKSQLLQLSRRYQAALRSHLSQGRLASLESARGLGSEALAAGLQTLDLAKLHEQTLVTELLPGCHTTRKRASLIKQAGVFFAVAITPIEKTHPGARKATIHLKKFIETLSQRTVELAASNLELSLERRKISRELHDVIAQTLTGINVRLANLKKEALINTKGLDRKIARTQRLVEQSVNIVHQFARELRPAVLDDLGLIPALHSYMKNFTAETGVRTRLTAFAGVEKLDASRRTVLYRVAQEALTNITRHAQATQAQVDIQKLDGAICMRITDNGKGFQKERLAQGKKNRRLGLLGMRERVEMVQGRFNVESGRGKGTTIEALFPFVDSPPAPISSSAAPNGKP